MKYRYTIEHESHSNREVYYYENKRFRFALYKYHNDKNVIYLSSIHVNEEYRQQGIGNWILAEADKLAKKYGSKTIMLQVKTNSWMHSWYERHGYCFYSKEKGYTWLKKDMAGSNIG